MSCNNKQPLGYDSNRFLHHRGTHVYYSLIQIFFTGFLDRYEIMNLLGKRKQICKAHTGDAKNKAKKT